ncbi:MAG: GNAT family N-acetyltransferase [Gammaproteobacteria bacterium]|nr:GNAT family N-acetyltransferase [Gammaproteobacteria bacterium]MBU1724987.1 GNAT family N-acetyltransferase [Gammaproteobacteria bacterium]MBU2007097.1 GNAT family N-acetyltransferase [Gammaproteobacteria bacterium]
MMAPNLAPVLPEESEWIAGQLVGMTPWRELGYQADTLRNYLLGSQTGFQALCLHVEGSPAGIITLRSPWLRGTLLELLAVLPEFQQQGLGKWLMQWLQANARDKNQRNLWTLVSAFNTPAIRFYQSQGFTTIGQLDDFIVNGQHELLLRYIIEPIISIDQGESHA